MANFDREIKKRIRDVELPASYDKKVEQTLQTIRETEEDEPSHRARNSRRKWVVRVAVCLACIIGIVSVTTLDAQANIFEAFKQNIMDFFGLSSKEEAADVGVESETIYSESKPDLMMETQEVVIDSHSIYLLVKITASSGVEFAEDVGFDYFCFCEGDNYNNDNLLSGARNCALFEVSEEKPNMATYIVSITFDQELEEGTNVTAYFKDLEKGPYSDSPEMLVEGMWSITFPFCKTVTEQIEIPGDAEMEFAYIDTTATVVSLTVTPLGLVLIADVSNFPYDELGLADTTIAIRLKLIDGSEIPITSRTEALNIIQGGSRSFELSGDKSYQQETLEFAEVISLEKVCGIYIEDLYIPVTR